MRRSCVSNLLINEHPLMVLPTLAAKIGLNEAIVLQQIHYWLDPRGNKNFREGRHWVYNSYKDWKKQFPFWSEVTLRRVIYSLESLGFLKSQEFKKEKGDKTKWYTIDYKKLSESSSPCDQNDQMGVIKMIRPYDQNDQIIYKDTKTTTEITNPSLYPSTELTSERRNKSQKNILEEGKEIPFSEVIQIWAETVGKGGGPSLTNFRKKSIAKAFEETFNSNLKEWRQYCSKITSNKFLMGETEKHFKPTLDWCLKEETIEKVLGGFYQKDRKPVSFDTQEDIEASEKDLLRVIRGEDSLILTKDLKNAIREIFRRRIEFGLEGQSLKEKLLDGGKWYGDGFEALLEDYIEGLKRKIEEEEL